MRLVSGGEGGWCGGVVVVMKISSWNVRVLGGFEKRREVCQLVREKKSIHSLPLRNEVVYFLWVIA